MNHREECRRSPSLTPRESRLPRASTRSVRERSRPFCGARSANQREGRRRELTLGGNTQASLQRSRRYSERCTPPPRTADLPTTLRHVPTQSHQPKSLEAAPKKEEPTTAHRTLLSLSMISASKSSRPCCRIKSANSGKCPLSSSMSHPSSVLTSSP